MAASRFLPPATGEAKQAFADVAKALDDRTLLGSYPIALGATLTVAAGEFRRVSPRSSGMRVTLPAAVGDNFGQSVTLFVEAGRGTLTITAAAGTVDGVDSLAFGAGTYFVELRSNGNGRWATLSSTIALLAPVAANTFLGNVTATAGPVTANSLATLAGAGLTYAAGAIGWDGATPLVPDGDMGHIVVSASGTVWLWDPAIVIAGNQSIETSSNLDLQAGRGAYLNAVRGVLINGGSLSGLEIDSGDVAINATGGVGIYAGATPVTGSPTRTVTISSDNDVVLSPADDFVVNNAGVESLRINANQSWNVAGSSGSSGQVLMTRGSSSTPVWADSGGVYSMTANASASAAVTTIGTGNYVIPANVPVIGSVYRFTGYLRAVRGGTATALNILIRCVFNGATVPCSVNVPFITTAITKRIRVEVLITFRTIGGAGTVQCEMWAAPGGAATTTANATMDEGTTTTDALATNVNMTLTVDAAMSAGVAATSITWTQAIWEKVL